jgi:glucose-1-phosphate adenylyltransferase
VIERAIVDKNCRVGRRVRIVNERGGDTSPDAADCVVRDGIPIVVKEATLPEGWSLSH